MTTRQLELVGVARREAQGNRGRLWQDILDRTHVWYLGQRRGRVYSIRNEWDYVPRWLWDRQPANRRARTAEGGLLMRMKSAPDYVGSVGRWAVQFDAKEFSNASIPYDNFSVKQIEDLNASFVAGNEYSGFMVLQKRTMEVFWCRADFVYNWHMMIKRNAPGVVKSLNFSKFADEGVRRLGVCDGHRFDYAPALIPQYNAETLKAA